MAKQILNSIWVIVLSSETYIAILKVVNLKRIPRWNEYPNSYVKLSIMYNQRVFDVFLGYPCFSAPIRWNLQRISLLWWHLAPIANSCKVKYVLILRKDLNIPSPTKTSRLDDPKVVGTIHVGLHKELFQFSDLVVDVIGDGLPHFFVSVLNAWIHVKCVLKLLLHLAEPLLVLHL